MYKYLIQYRSSALCAILTLISIHIKLHIKFPIWQFWIMYLDNLIKLQL